MENSDFSALSKELSNEIGGSKFARPRSMVNQIYRDLAGAISKGVLEPGQLLRESELQQWFRTSRAPIREAIRLLEADGLVTVDTYKKKYVRRITLETLKETIPVMACLEGFAANLASERITSEQIGILQKINEEMKIAFEEKKFNLCSQLNFSFHRTYVKLSDNNTLIKAIRSIMKNTIWLMTTNLYYNKSELIPLSMAEHKNIINAFQERNGKEVEEEVRKHIRNIIERWLYHWNELNLTKQSPYPSGGDAVKAANVG